MTQRTRKLVPQIRTRAFQQRNGLFVPRTEGDKKSTWPVCMTCNHDVDSVNVEDVTHERVVIRAMCHGSEDVLKVDFPYQITRRKDADTWEHVRTAMNSATFFDPSHE